MVSHQKKISKNKTVVIRNAVKAKNRPRRMKSKATSRRSGNAAQRNAQSARAAPVFGPVSTIDTAPVSIGNTVQGCSPVVTPVADGVRVRGRDFLITANATATSVTGWCLIAGSPITPECMSASILKGYCNSYAQYQVHGVALHFVTSSTTADAGSVLLYVGKDRAAPGLIPTAANLLPFVLSDHCTVISPVWKNASAVYHPSPAWYTTGLGNDEGLHEQACGEMFVLSKVTEANSPGYILMDYDITFRNMQVNIKSLTFPITRMKYTEIAYEINAGVASGVTAQLADNVLQLLDGTTNSTTPTGTLVGDVFKMIVNITGSSASGALTLANAWVYTISGLTSPVIPIVDGLTVYATFVGSNKWIFYPTYEAAVTGINAIQWSGGGGATLNLNLHAFVSWVGTVSGSELQANY